MYANILKEQETFIVYDNLEVNASSIDIISKLNTLGVPVGDMEVVDVSVGEKEETLSRSRYQPPLSATGLSRNWSLLCDGDLNTHAVTTERRALSPPLFLLNLKAQICTL
ncbi:hypothetical protein LXL04_022174 [Taraxacum kok-saghyz]